jgi:hypothetical protein
VLRYVSSEAIFSAPETEKTFDSLVWQQRWGQDGLRSCGRQGLKHDQEKAGESWQPGSWPVFM